MFDFVEPLGAGGHGLTDGGNEEMVPPAGSWLKVGHHRRQAKYGPRRSKLQPPRLSFRHTGSTPKAVQSAYPWSMPSSNSRCHENKSKHFNAASEDQIPARKPAIIHPTPKEPIAASSGGPNISMTKPV